MECWFIHWYDNCCMVCVLFCLYCFVYLFFISLQLCQIVSDVPVSVCLGCEFIRLLFCFSLLCVYYPPLVVMLMVCLLLICGFWLGIFSSSFLFPLSKLTPILVLTIYSKNFFRNNNSRKIKTFSPVI